MEQDITENRQLRDQLRALPAIEPDGSLLARLEDIVGGNAGESAPKRLNFGGWTLAATVLLSLMIGLLLVDRETMQAPPGEGIAQTQPAPSSEPAGYSDLGLLIAQSAVLDQVNATIPERPRVQQVRSAGRIASIEDRVALLDAALATPGFDAELRTTLMRERVDLMDTLVGLRTGQPDNLWL